MAQAMNMENDSDTYVYRIDKDNVIEMVSDNWQSFVDENNGAGSCNQKNVIGLSLSDFIYGSETRYLYQIILKRVRDRKQTAKLLFRCDSPDIRRFLQLIIIPLENDAVEFRSHIIRTEKRECVNLLKNDVARSDIFIRMCSVCKKIAISDKEWEDAEKAINTLKIFDNPPFPTITHGICQCCYNTVMSGLEGL